MAPGLVGDCGFGTNNESTLRAPKGGRWPVGSNWRSCWSPLSAVKSVKSSHFLYCGLYENYWEGEGVRLNFFSEIRGGSLIFSSPKFIDYFSLLLQCS